jgi:hypothetical protein
MGMFDESDFDALQERMNDVPDGVLDASPYVKVFKKVYDHLYNLDVDDETSKVRFMMNIMNLFDPEEDPDEVTSTVYEIMAVMSFHIVQLIGITQRYEEDFKNMYIAHLREKIIPDLEENSGAVPYWE